MLNRRDSRSPAMRAVLALASLLLIADINAAPQQPGPPLDTYQFGGGDLVAVDLRAAADGYEIVWPSTARPLWDTALLAVHVIAGETGIPFVTVAAGDRAERQYFRAGEAGPRWINLSALRERLTPGGTVVIRAESLVMGTGTTSLRLYSSAPDLTKSILVLAPHPDDAEIAAFGLYAGRRATVVTVTAGNAGSATYESVFSDVPEQYRFKGWIRAVDSVTVPWLGGIPPERCFNLGYFDARLRDMHAQPEQVVPERYGPNTDIAVYRAANIGSLLPKQSRSSTWRNLVDDLERILDKVDPDVIVAPHPQLDTHLDHQFTTVALAEALTRRRHEVTLLLYTNHADGNRYPYGPAGTLVSLPPPVARPVTIDRVYSHPVAPAVQRLKLFALESMHDLRFTPTRQYLMGAGEGRTIEPEKPGPGADVTYYRRAPRTNELFFMYDQRTLAPMIAAFLAARE
jgi:LmbE family N-acetylglucosaminyl deacetylase